MIQVRNGVFETNSSSSHSIVIAKGKKNDRIYTEEEFKDRFYLDEKGRSSVWEHTLDFGRSPFHIISGFREKVLYAIAYFCGSYQGKEQRDYYFREITDIVKKYVDGFDGFNMPKERYWNEDTEEKGYYYGSVDHQSYGLLKSILNGEGISLEEFLTNKKYVIVIDGDEYNEFDCLIESGLFNTASIDKVYSASHSIENMFSKKGKAGEVRDSRFS